MHIQFKDCYGTPIISSISIPQGQVYTQLTLGNPYGSPSLGYTARVYNELGQEVGSALNLMDGTGWRVNVVGRTVVEDWYQKEKEKRIEENSIFDSMEALLPQYCGKWERYRSPGLLQSMVDNVVTVNYEKGVIRAYWHNEARWETLLTP